MSERVGIIGAGIAGLTSAIMFRNMGFEVSVFEAAKKVRGIGAGMGMASNAVKAFEYLGLDEEVVAIGNKLSEFVICDSKGRKIIEIDSDKIRESYQKDNYTIHRADLHSLLLSEIPSDAMFTGKRLVQFAEYKDKVMAVFEDGAKESFDYLIAADGVNSIIRQMLIPESKPRYSGYWCWRNVVEMKDKDASKVVEIWGKKGRFGITPLTKNRYYWFACINSNLKDGIKNFRMSELMERFKDYSSDVSEILSLSKDEELISTPIVDIAPLSKFHFRRILLIGDAAHATTPNMGQGACMAIEDVAVLQDELKRNEAEKAFSNFEKRRVNRTKYIIDKSLLAGKVAQTENPTAIFFRNNLFRAIPASLGQSQIKRLYTEDFMDV